MHGFRGRANEYWSHRCPNILARTEECFLAEGWRGSLRQDDWGRVLPGGFAIYSNFYLEVGGFEHAFNRFADLVLGATFHSQGRRLGDAAGAAVRTLEALSESLRQGGRDIPV